MCVIMLSLNEKIEVYHHEIIGQPLRDGIFYAQNPKIANSFWDPGQNHNTNIAKCLHI